jgi:hydroxymethylbilane synthase
MYPELSLRLVTMKTKGDIHVEIPLEGAGPDFSGKDLFTGTLEQALMRDEIDLCVHNLKDMAETENPDLPIAAMAKRGDPRDMLVLPRARSFSGWDALERSPPVGCSSSRRRIQLLAMVPGLTTASIRGNVPTRLVKMDQGGFGALILAAAGLERLGIRGRSGYCFPVREMIPAAGQGVLAVQGRHGEDYAFLDAVRDPVTTEEAHLERELVRALGGGCGAPAAAFARISGNEVTLLGMYAANPHSSPVKDEITGAREEGHRLVERLARRLLLKEVP